MHDVARPVLNRPMQSPPKRRRKGIVIAIALLLAIGVFVVWHQIPANRQNDEHAAHDAADDCYERIGERGRLGSEADSGGIG